VESRVRQTAKIADQFGVAGSDRVEFGGKRRNSCPKACTSAVASSSALPSCTSSSGA